MVVRNSKNLRLARMKAVVGRKQGFIATVFKKKGKRFGTSITRRK